MYNHGRDSINATLLIGNTMFYIMLNEYTKIKHILFSNQAHAPIGSQAVCIMVALKEYIKLNTMK